MRRILSTFLGVLLFLSLHPSQATNLKEIEQEISDSVITTKITAKFAKNKDLSPLKISVSTVNGVVKLKGNVKNKEAFVKALRLAVATKGVKLIDTDHLMIKAVNSSFTDAYITAKVEAAVLKAKVLDDESIPLVGINATTTNGNVTLSGHVKNEKSIAAILKRVSAIRGVKKIISGLEVAKVHE
jgi:hyperosmotically inducible protein